MSEGSNTEDLNNMIANQYAVDILDANNCFTSNQITLIEPTSLNLSHELSDYNSFNLSCFESNDGFINSSVIGSVPPYTFSWSNGDNTANIDDLPSGYYNLVVTDINNCFISSNHFLTEPEDFNVNLVFSNDTCDKGVGSTVLLSHPKVIITNKMVKL